MRQTVRARRDDPEAAGATVRVSAALLQSPVAVALDRFARDDGAALGWMGWVASLPLKPFASSAMTGDMTIAATPPRNWLDDIRPAVRDIAPSGIVEVFQSGRGRQGLIPLYVGEGDLPTPPFIVDAIKASLDRGETFYTAQGGIPEFRQAVAAYMTRVYGAAPDGKPFRAESFFATIGGMHAIDIAMRLLAGPGDDVLIPSPSWPNFAGAVESAGARVVAVPLDAAGRWSLDPERLAAAVTPETRVILFNSPANPTGFVATGEEIAATLAIARRHGLWIIADEVYGRLTYDGRRAPLLP